MKNFMVLHYGFEKPTPEIMGAWGKWFQSLGDKMLDAGHLPSGREFSKAGTKELPLAADSITGFTLIQAESLDEAAKIAAECPFIASTRVYEIMRKG
ncbi:MAG TPA: YciI family protein [Polyangiaceae bacterium]|nr:YciI family protein [Polyangiaceae bacterium]HMR78054.1 YciI family protein [Polyangiaceae bacterium]